MRLWSNFARNFNQFTFQLNSIGFFPCWLIGRKILFNKEKEFVWRIHRSGCWFESEEFLRNLIYSINLSWLDLCRMGSKRGDRLGSARNSIAEERYRCCEIMFRFKLQYRGQVKRKIILNDSSFDTNLSKIN